MKQLRSLTVKLLMTKAMEPAALEILGNIIDKTSGPGRRPSALSAPSALDLSKGDAPKGEARGCTAPTCDATKGEALGCDAITGDAKESIE
jgi:hypothetical protein